MATNTILGTDIVLEYDLNYPTSSTPDWALVACGTESGLDGSRETIDVKSKCGPGQLAGTKTETYNFTGFLQKDAETDPGVVSINEMRVVFKTDNTVGHFRAYDLETGGQRYYREFYGPITTFNETTNQDEAVGFNLVIAINGDTIDVLPTT